MDKKKRNVKRGEMVRKAIRALGEEFSIGDLNRALGENVTYKSLVYPFLARMKEDGLLDLLEGKRPRSFRKTATLLEKEKEVPQKVAEEVHEEKIVEDRYLMNIVRKAVEDYPEETFSRRDILNFLRSSTKGVAINYLTVYDYVGRKFTLDKITERVGKEGRTMLFKRGPAIVTVEKFESAQHSGDIVPPVSSSTIEDLELTEEESGRVVFAFMKRQEEELEESKKQTDVLLNGLKEFRRTAEMTTIENARLLSVLEEKDRAFSDLKGREKSLEKNVTDLVSALREKEKELLFLKNEETRRRGKTIVLKGSFKELSKVKGMFPSRRSER